MRKKLDKYFKVCILLVSVAIWRTSHQPPAFAGRKEDVMSNRFLKWGAVAPDVKSRVLDPDLGDAGGLSPDIDIDAAGAR